ncbi:MAG: hypothetical protein IBX39_04095 [Candidatus Methanoperedenaceae archaeon]|nr:hypothetical protein [Candidatus Methanoperedenaceae archaeon]
MSELEENQKIRKITNLLEKGGTMLANHHDCGAPMFRYMGKIICPVCDIGRDKPPVSGVEKVARDVWSGEKIPSIVDASPAGVESVNDVNKQQPMISRYLSDIGIENQIRNKLKSLALDIEDERDPRILREKMECIELGIRILKSLKN